MPEIDLTKVPYDKLIDAILENMAHDGTLPYKTRNTIRKHLNAVRDLIRPYAS